MYPFCVKEMQGKRHMRSCEDNIKIGLKEAGWEVVCWINLATTNAELVLWVA